MFLLLQVANFHHRRGGMWRAIEIGTAEAVNSKETLETTYDVLLIGSFAAMALYNLLLYAVGGKRTKGPLFLGLLFAVLVFRIPMMGQMVITRLLPAFPWGVQLRTEYVTAKLALLTLTWTFAEIYPGIISKRFATGVTLFVLLTAAVVVLGPILLYSRIVRYYVYTMIALLFYETIALTVALIRGYRPAWYGIGAAAITFFITLGETIHYQELILSRDFAPFGFLITVVAGESINQTTAYMISGAINLLLLFLVANLIALRGSHALFSVSDSGVAAAVADSPSAALHPPETAGRQPEPIAAAWSEELQEHRVEELREQYGITEREGEIVRLVAQGLSNKEIASRLYVSEATVKTHMYRILRKTGLGNRTELGRAFFVGWGNHKD